MIDKKKENRPFEDYTKQELIDKLNSLPTAQKLDKYLVSESDCEAESVYQNPKRAFIVQLDAGEEIEPYMVYTERTSDLEEEDIRLYFLEKYFQRINAKPGDLIFDYEIPEVIIEEFGSQVDLKEIKLIRKLKIKT